MKNFFLKIKTYAFTHKIISVIVLVIILLVGYWGYGKMHSTASTTRYVISTVTSGTIISSVTESGQVSALNQVTISPTVSGALTAVYVKPGDKVYANQTLFVVDNTSAQKTVRDAEIGLQNANLSLQKLQLQNSNTNLDTALSKAYDDGFSAVSSAFLDLPSTITGLQNVLSEQNLSDNSARNAGNTALNYRNQAETLYYQAQSALVQNQKDFTTINRNSPKTDIENIIKETYNTTKNLADAITSTKNFVDYLAQDGKASDFSSAQATLSTYTNTTNTHLSDLLSATTNIGNNKDAFSSSDLNTQSAEISIKQAQNTLLDAQQNLSYYYIKAPFDGVISSVPVIKGANVGSGTTLGTIITSKELAVVSLNEIDVAKISLGQKATLTFDAIPDLTIAGQVAEIDSVGTVSSGVVNYNVQISFDSTSNDGVKPGMSVSAAIITNVAQNVLIVPSSAIKTQNGSSYVQVFDVALPAPLTGVQGSPSTTPPRNQTIEIGISNGTSTQIISGLNSGDEVVSKTITSTTKTTATTTTPSILGSTTNRGGAGAVRIP